MSRRLHPTVLVVLFCAVLLAGSLYLHMTKEQYHPLHLVEPEDFPLFIDDMDRGSLLVSAQHQLAYLKKQNPENSIVFGSRSYSNEWLLSSLKEFIAKLTEQPSEEELTTFLQKNYLLYQAGGRKKAGNRKMLVTGYYEPVFSGSLTKDDDFTMPIYSLPKSLVTLPAEGGNKKRVGRYTEDRQFVPFWSRAEIEKLKLLAGEELAYLKDPFDAFLLHVQGSGKIRLPDNSIRSIHFAGSNGLKYNSIGKLLVDEKIMRLKDVNIPAIRAYLESHPEQLRRILHHNPRFIFFHWGDSPFPKGSNGEELTPGRSIAMDSSALPGGTIGYLRSRRPVVDEDGTVTDWTPLNRFVFPQDSGAAIKGTGRVDLFWGNGGYAEHAANHMKEDGQLFFLVKKPL